jgi:hypothetical protein
MIREDRGTLKAEKRLDAPPWVPRFKPIRESPESASRTIILGSPRSQRG